MGTCSNNEIHLSMKIRRRTYLVKYPSFKNLEACNTFRKWTYLNSDTYLDTSSFYTVYYVSIRKIMPAIKIAALLLLRIHTFMNTKKWNRNRNMFYLLNIVTLIHLEHFIQFSILLTFKFPFNG